MGPKQKRNILPVDTNHAAEERLLHVFDLVERAGQTLGVWGAGPGFYLVLPVFGPSNLRDTFGLVGDLYMDPRSYVEDEEAQYGLFMLDKVNELSLDKDTYEALKAESLDPYLTVRAAYSQHRAAKVKE